MLVGKIPAGQSDMVSTRPRKTPTDSKSQASRINVGVTDILSWIGKQSGIDSDVYASADKVAPQKLISIARFWMANPDKSIRRIEEWQISHQIPYAEGLSEDSCYLLMKQLGTDISISQNYFRKRASHSSSKASVAVDATTVSSYSESLNDVRFGYNKGGNGLATVKLLTLFSLEDHQPHAHGESEQYHSELKTDMDLELLPSGKFETNELVLETAILSYIKVAHF